MSKHIEYEKQLNGDYWRKEYREDGSLMATFYAAAQQVRRTDTSLIVVDHKGDPTTFTGKIDGTVFTNGTAPLPPPNPLLIKRDRLDVLRAKGWTNLTAAEQIEARGLAFDLGQWAPG